MWGKYKYNKSMDWKERIEVENLVNRVKLVTVSGVAFVLLVFEYYILKWEMKYQQ